MKCGSCLPGFRVETPPVACCGIWASRCLPLGGCPVVPAGVPDQGHSLGWKEQALVCPSALSWQQGP